MIKEHACLLFFGFWAVLWYKKDLWTLSHFCLACFQAYPFNLKSWPGCARTMLPEKTSCDVTASSAVSRGTHHLAGRQPRWCAAWRSRAAPLARRSRVGLRTDIVHSIWPPTRRRTTAWWCRCLRSFGCTGARWPGCRRKQQGIRLASATDAARCHPRQTRLARRPWLPRKGACFAALCRLPTESQ